MELHADVLSRLEPADIARYRVAASASTQTAAHSADIAELAARQALLAFAERTYTDFVKGGREVWTDGTEYSADANDMWRLVQEPLGPGTLHGGLLNGRREWPEIVQVLACDPDSFEPLDLTEGVYESEAGSETRVMMTYDDGEWDGAPRRGIGRRDANIANIAPLPGETWLGCWAATCAFVAAGTNATLGACRTDRPKLPIAPARAVAGEGVPGPRRAHLPAEAKATAAVAHVRGADARDVDERAQIGIGVVCVYATLNYVRYLRSLGARTRVFEAARARAMATAERLASIGRWELAVALTRAAVPEMESDPPNAPKAVEEINRPRRFEWSRDRVPTIYALFPSGCPYPRGNGVVCACSILRSPTRRARTRRWSGTWRATSPSLIGSSIRYTQGRSCARTTCKTSNVSRCRSYSRVKPSARCTPSSARMANGCSRSRRR